MVPGLVLIGLGYGPVLVTTVTLATTSLPASQQGLASGVINSTANVAGALGAAIYTTSTHTIAATVSAPSRSRSRPVTPPPSPSARP